MKKIILSILISILFLPFVSYSAGTGTVDTHAGALGGALVDGQRHINQPGNDADISQSSKLTRWTVSTEALVFERVGTAKRTLVERVSGDEPFLAVPTAPSTIALSSTDLNQGFSPGFRLAATYHADSNCDISLSYFRIAEWGKSQSVGPDNPLNWLLMKSPGGFFQTQDFAYQSMTWNYSTQLYNAELNAQKKVSKRITLLAGFRWLKLQDDLQGTIPPADIFVPTWKNTNPGYTLSDVEQITTGTIAPAYPPFWNTSAVNNLYGLQLGVDGELFERGRFSIDGLIKAGGYWNHAIESTGVSIAKTVYQSGASTDHLAFVSEAGLRCKYKINSRLTLKFGYEALWLAGVALAPGQIQNTNSTSSPTTVTGLDVNSGSHVLFHGATAGLEFSF